MHGDRLVQCDSSVQAGVHQVDAAARKSISSLQRTKVGHVGRQKPQWTQSAVSSRMHARPPFGSSSRRSCSTRNLDRTLWLGATRLCFRRVGDARRGADDGFVGQRALRRAGRIEAHTSERGALSRTRPLHSATSTSTPPTKVAAAAICASTARGDPSKRTRMPPGCRTSARSVAAGSEGAERRGQPLVGLDHEGRPTYQVVRRRKLARTIGASLPSSTDEGARGRSPRRS